MRLKYLILTGLLACSTSVLADELQSEMLLKQLSVEHNITALSVAESPVIGLFEVVTERGIIYSDSSGQYVFSGELYDMNESVNLTDLSLSKLRKEKLETYADDMIIYPAKEEKYVITVFTDTSCGYCRKLHSQLYSYKGQNPETGKSELLPGYTDLGITVRYLAYPRGGQRSPAYEQMVSVWCADDKAKAMTKAKSGQKIEPKTCDNSIMGQYQLGDLFGVRGTPALVLSDGLMVPGYQSPTDLFADLEKMNVAQ